MPINESRNSRLSISRGASRSSYNLKDPPEIGSRRDPVSQEARESFYKFLEHFYPKALSEYHRERLALLDELSFVRMAHADALEKVQFEPGSKEQEHWPRIHAKLERSYENEMISRERELYSRFEREYLTICRNVSTRTHELKRGQTELQSMREAIARWTELREQKKPVSPSIGAVIHSAASLPSPRLDNGTTLSPMLSSDWHSVPPLPNPRERAHPRATFVASPRVSIPETRIPSERAQLVRSPVSPSSLMPDSLPAPRGLKMSPPVVAREPLPARRSSTKGSRPSRSMSEMASSKAVSLPLPRPSVPTKAQEQPIRTILNSREFPNGNSLTGIKPTTRVVSALRMNTRADVKPPATTKKEVSLVKGTSAAVCSPASKAAPTLPKSMPTISSIQAPPASSSEDEAFLSSRNVPMQSASDVVSTRQVLGKGSTHLNSEARTPSRASRSLMLPPLARSLPNVDSKQRVVNVISTRRAVSNGTHRNAEARVRVSPKVIIPRSGEIPSAGYLEHPEECSTVVARPAVKLAPTSSSSFKVGERLRWVSATAVSIQNVEVNEDGRSPDPSTALMPSATPSVPPTRVGSHLQRPDELISPSEVISRRRIINIRKTCFSFFGFCSFFVLLHFFYCISE